MLPHRCSCVRPIALVYFTPLTAVLMVARVYRSRFQLVKVVIEWRLEDARRGGVACLASRTRPSCGSAFQWMLPWVQTDAPSTRDRSVAGCVHARDVPLQNPVGVSEL